MQRWTEAAAAGVLPVGRLPKACATPAISLSLPRLSARRGSLVYLVITATEPGNRGLYLHARRVLDFIGSLEQL